MRTHVLRIIAISLLGVCLLCSLAKMSMKNENSKKTCDNACGILMFVALALIGVSQLKGETEKYGTDDTPTPTPHRPRERVWCDSLSGDATKCMEYLNKQPVSTATPYDCVGDSDKNPGTNCCRADDGVYGNNGTCLENCKTSDMDCQSCGWSTQAGSFTCPVGL